MKHDCIPRKLLALHACVLVLYVISEENKHLLRQFYGNRT